jgi:2-phospho-L-lactate/phosphoenolpyruvate guanylyltransferase
VNRQPAPSAEERVRQVGPALVPLGDPSRNKSRLASTLSPAERRALVETMLRHVTSTLSEAGLGDVVVLAQTKAAANVARGIGIAALVQPPGLPGLNRAIRWARLECGAAVVVMADLPQLTASEVRRFLSIDADVVIAEGHDGGTGGLVFDRWSRLEPAFGRGSAAAHRAAADRLGLRHATVTLEGFAYDVDVPRDLDRLTALDDATGDLARTLSHPVREGRHHVA